MSHRFQQGAASALLVAVAWGSAADARQDANAGVTDAAIRIGVEADIGSLSLDGENSGFRLAFEEANAGTPCTAAESSGPSGAARAERRPTCSPSRDR